MPGKVRGSATARAAQRDRRYAVRLEFCGYAEPRYVVRFCGEWLGQALSYAAAEELVLTRIAARNAAKIQP